jgi:thiol-disulfide isomerase/thioredoxin
MRILKKLILVLMVIVAVAYWRGSRPKQEIDWNMVGVQSNGAMTPRDPRDFKLKDLTGREVSLSQFKGRPILLNFWASWCPPCLEETPSLLKFAAWGMAAVRMVTLAVSVDENQSLVDKFVREKILEKKLWPLPDLPFTILMNPGADVAAAYGTKQYPETYFIDPSFKMVRKFTGLQDWNSEEIMQWVTEHSK